MTSSLSTEHIDTKIMRLRRALTLHEDDSEQVQEISEEIEALRAQKRALMEATA